MSNSVYINSNKLNDNTYLSDDAVRDEYYLFRIARHVTILARMQAPVQVYCQGDGFKTLKTHCHIVERRWSTTTQAIIVILPEKMI